MDNQNMPQGSENPTLPVGQPAPESKPVGALIGSIIIVIILIIGGFYLWSTKVAPVAEPPMMDQQGMPAMNGTSQAITPEEQALNQPDIVLSQMAAVATSDEVSSIDADLKATNLDNLSNTDAAPQVN